MPSNRISPITLIFVILALAITASTQTTAFTYQGKLTDNNSPANGVYQMQFTLYDAVADGISIGSAIVVDPVSVVNGVFTVQLVFPSPSAFDGGPRWLEIAVKKSSDPSFTALNPRQQLTSSPYAIKALQADSAATATNSSQLGGIDASDYVQTDNPALTDARNPLPGSSDYIQNTTSTQPLSNFNVSGEGKANVLSAVSYFGIGGDRVLAADANMNTHTGIGSGASNAGSANSFFGRDAGRGNTSGSYNSFFGAAAGFSIQSGERNAFFGYQAGNATTSGSFNSFFGTSAGLSNQTGQRNAFFGYQAGNANTFGTNNAFFGADSGSTSSGASNNSFFGTEAGMKNTNSGNSFFGYAAGKESVAGANNVFVGVSTGSKNFDGDANVFVGYSAGSNNDQGDQNVFVGVLAGAANTSGFQNTLLGSLAQVSTGNLTNATAIGANSVVSQSNSLILGENANVGIGTSAPASKLTVVGQIETTTGGVKFPDGTIQTTAFGSSFGILNQTSQQAGANFNISGTGKANILDAGAEFNLSGARILAAPGLWNLLVGESTGSALSSGQFDTFVGSQAGSLNTTGSSNSFFGARAGMNNLDGSNNVFVGRTSGLSNTSGSFNTYVGSSAGQSNTTGNDNTYIGTHSGSLNTSGIQNTYLGSSSGGLGTTGSRNAYLGYEAGRGVTGSDNTFVGADSGESSNTANNVTLLGSGTDVGADSLQYATAIGAESVVSTDNTIVLGRSNGSDKVRIPGLGAAGATSLCRNANNEIATCSSSLRYKTAVAPFRSGLSIVNGLMPITFEWRDNGVQDLGLGAEYVAKVSELLVIRNAEGQVEGVKYDRVGVVLLNAVKEQQAQIEELKKQIEELKRLLQKTYPSKRGQK